MNALNKLSPGKGFTVIQAIAWYLQLTILLCCPFLVLSYATFVRSVYIVNNMLFQLPRRNIFGGFQWNLGLLVVIILMWFNFSPKFAKKYAWTVAEITLTPQKLQSWWRRQMKGYGHSYLFVKRRFFILGQLLALE